MSRFHPHVCKAHGRWWTKNQIDRTWTRFCNTWQRLAVAIVKGHSFHLGSVYSKKAEDRWWKRFADAWPAIVHIERNRIAWNDAGWKGMSKNQFTWSLDRIVAYDHQISLDSAREQK